LPEAIKRWHESIAALQEIVVSKIANVAHTRAIKRQVYALVGRAELDVASIMNAAWVNVLRGFVCSVVAENPGRSQRAAIFV
jgi:hypothetical protein